MFDKIFENITENIGADLTIQGLFSYFSPEIFCIIGILINILMFLFFPKKYNIKKLSDLITCGILSINTLILGVVLIFVKDINFSIFNNFLLFNDEVLLLKFLINLFLALFVLIVSKITSNARFKMTFANSNLLFLAIFSMLFAQVSNPLSVFIFLDLCSFFIYKYASSMRMKKPVAFCVDYILMSGCASVLFYSFYIISLIIKDELQLAIIQVCMACALLLKAGLFPIYNYSLNKQSKNNLAYSLLLFLFLPFLGILSFIKYSQSYNFLNEVYFASFSVFVLVVILASSFAAYKTKNIVRFLANCSYFLFGFYLISYLFSQNEDLCLKSVFFTMFALLGLYALVNILRLNYKTEKLNLNLIQGLFIKNRFFAILFSILLLMCTNVFPSAIMFNNLSLLKAIYKFDSMSFYAVLIILFANFLVLANVLKIIKSMYTKADFPFLTKRTTFSYIVPSVVIILLIIKIFL